VENGNGQVSPPTDNRFGAGTSTTSFSGLTPNTTYTVYVYAWNHQGCTAVSSNQVTPRATPGTVTNASAGAPSPNGEGFWDAPLVSPSATQGTFYKFRIVVGGGAGQEQRIVANGSQFLSDPTAYGRTGVGFQLKQCDIWQEYPDGLCSASWSTTFPMQEPIANTQLGSLKAVSGGLLGGGTWSWGSIPTGSYTAMDYRCANGGQWATLVENGSCTAPGIGTPALQVRITANGGQTYVRSYDAGDYPG
jgi:hypothetical protein